jgi:hypothetical protein
MESPFYSVYCDYKHLLTEENMFPLHFRLYKVQNDNIQWMKTKIIRFYVNDDIV